MRFLPNRDSIKGIITYYISLLIFIASGIGVWEKQSLLACTVFLLSFITMLIQDIAWFRKVRIHPHDKNLIEQLSELLGNKDTLDLLKSRDLVRETYTGTEVLPLQNIDNHWDDIDHTFLNTKHQQQLMKLKEKIQALLEILYNHTFKFNPNFFSVVPPKDKQEDEALIAERKQYAQTATDLLREIYAIHQHFRRIYINKMQQH